MNGRIINNIKILGFSVFALFFMALNVYARPLNDTLSEGDTEAILGLRVWKCSNMEGETDYDKSEACYDSYIADDGSLDSFELTSGGNVDPGELIMVGATFQAKTGHIPTDIVGIQWRIFYDNNFYVAAGDEEGEFSPKEPSKEYAQAKVNRKDVQIHQLTASYQPEGTEDNPTPLEDRNQLQGYIVKANASYPDTPLKPTQAMAFYFLYVKDDATGSSTLTWGPQGNGHDECDATSADSQHIQLSGEDFKLTVAGGASSTDNSLDALTVSYNGQAYAVDTTTPFTSGSTAVTEYLYYVPNSVTDIDIYAKTNDNGAKITTTLTDIDPSDQILQTEDNVISDGNTSFTFTVTSAAGTTQLYTVKVYRLSIDTSIDSLTLDGISVSRSGNTFNGLTTYQDEDTVITVRPHHQNATVATGNGVTTGPGSWTFTESGANVNTRVVTVQSEQCDDKYRSLPGWRCESEDYTIKVTRSNASNDATLSALQYAFNNGTLQNVPGFSAGTTTELFNLGNQDYSNSTIKISASTTDGNATIVSGTGNNIPVSVGDNTFPVVVRAEDGTEKTYNIKVHRKSNKTTLNKLQVTSAPSGTLSPVFQQNYTGRYTYSYDPSVTTVSIKATVDDIGKAYVSIVDSSGGLPADYADYNKINEDTKSFTVPTTTVVTVIVTSENGDFRTYDIDLTRQQSINNSLSALRVEYEDDGGVTRTATISPTFTASTRRYSAVVPAYATQAVVVPTKAVEYSKVTRIGTTTGTDLTNATVTGLTFDGKEIEIAVESEGGIENIYYLTLSRAKYDIATLDSLNISEGNLTPAFTSANETYGFSSTIGFDTTMLVLTGTKTNEYASVEVSVEDEKGVEALQTVSAGANNSFSANLEMPTGTSKVKVKVIAHDGTTTKTYVTSITRDKNNDTNVKAIHVDQQIATPTFDGDHTYTVEVINSKTTLTPAEVGIQVSDDATVNKGASLTGLLTTEYKNFTFTVKAENGTEKEYILKVKRKKNNQAILTKETLTIGGQTKYCDIASGTFACTIDVPVNTSTFTVASTISSGATVEPVDGTEFTLAATDSSHTYEFVVKAEDFDESGISNTYQITVERQRSSDNTLQSLKVNNVAITPFNPTNNVYTDTQDGTTSSVSIEAKVTDIGKAKVYAATVKGTPVEVTGDISTGIYTFTAPLDYGTNAIVITVEAENEQKQNYNLTITREKNTSAALDNLEYYDDDTTSYVQVSGFTPNQGTYTLADVDYEVTTLKLKATPGDIEFGSATVVSVTNEKGVTTQSNITNEYTGSGNIYIATINLSTGTNTIVLNGIAHDDRIKKTYTIYVVRTKNDAKEVTNLKVKDVFATEDENHNYTVTLPNSVTNIATATDITYGLPDGAKATFTPSSLALVTTDVNNVVMTVTAEDGSIETHTIAITREKSSNTDLTRVDIKIAATDSYNNRVYNCLFEGGSTECTVDVPASTTAFTYTGYSTELDAGISSLSPENGGTVDLPATQSSKTLELTVTAEDNSSKLYTVKINRAKSTNADLATLTYKTASTGEFVSVPNFKANNVIYYITVDEEDDEIEFAATVADVGKAQILSGTGVKNLDFETSPFEIVVESETIGTTKTYVINVTRPKRTDATLQDITVNSKSLTQYTITPSTYDKDNEFEYTIEDEFDYITTSVEVGAIKNEEHQTITTGVGTNSLKTGTNTITIHVVAHDTSISKDYKINIKRKKNNSTALASIVLAGVPATYNTTDNIWEVSVPNSVAMALQTNLVITGAPGAVTNDPLAQGTFVDTNLDTANPTDVAITVTAEDGTIEPVTLRVTREKASIKTLHTLTVDDGVSGGSFNPSFVPDAATPNTFNVTVDESATAVTINATTTDPNAYIVQGVGTFNLTQSTSNFQIQVQSEIGGKTCTEEYPCQSYQINIIRSKSTDNTLKSVTVVSGTNVFDVTSFDTGAVLSDPADFAATTHYKVVVPGEIGEVVVDAQPTDPRAQILNSAIVNTTHTLSVGSQDIQIVVKSEAGAQQNYTLTIERAAKSNNRLSDLTVNGLTIPGFDPDLKVYTLSDVENAISDITIGATPEDADAQIVSGTGIIALSTKPNEDLSDEYNHLKVIVKAENGETETYTINVKRKKSDDNKLSSLSVNGYSISPTYNFSADPEVLDYYVNVNYDKETFGGTGDVFARPHNNTATVALDEPITLVTGEAKNYRIVVTAENGNIKTYTIHVTKLPSNNADLIAVDFNGTATLTGQFDGKHKTDYVVKVPYGQSTFTIEGIPEVDSTQVRGNNTYSSDVGTITITTYAEIYDENGTEEQKAATKTYTFTIEQAESNNAYLSNLLVRAYPFVGEHVTFSQAYTDYSIGDIDSSVSGLVVEATPENANSTITYYVNGTLQTDNTVVLPDGPSGAGTITVKVTAPDNYTTLVYTIGFKKIQSDNNYLKSLVPNHGTLNPTFIKTEQQYLLTVPNEYTAIEFEIITENRNAKINVNSGEDQTATDIKPYKYTLDNLEVGDTTLEVKVTSQSNKARTYVVVVRRAQPAANSDATLESLSVDDYPFIIDGSYTSTVFNKNIEDYSIGEIPYSLTKLKVNYNTTQGESNSSMLVGGASVVADSDGFITIPVENTLTGLVTVLVTAPDGSTTKTYNIHYKKQASDNAYLASLTTNKGSLSPDFSKTTLNYDLALPEGENSFVLTATLEDSRSKLTVNGEEKTSPASYARSGLSSGEYTIEFKVTAETGETQTYKVKVTVNATGELITSVTYGHTIADGYILTVAPNKTALDMKNELDNDNAKLQVWTADETSQLSDTDAVGTGMIVKLVINGEEKDRKVIVIKGDTNGDGEVDIFDAVGLLNHDLGTSALTGAYLKAGDVNDDNDVDIFDAVGILNHDLGVTPISSYK